MAVIHYHKELLNYAPSVPSVPVNVSVRQVGITSVSVSWGVPEHPNGLIIGYMVWYAAATDRDDEMVRGCLSFSLYLHHTHTIGTWR